MYLRLIITAVFPGLALALGAYLTDRYDREPVTLLFKLFILGFLSVIPAGIIEAVISALSPFTGMSEYLFTAFVVAGFTEEFIKRWIVIKSSFFNREFDEKLDGIIYAIFASLGFATAENILYVVVRFSNNPYIGISRGILSVPAHMLFAVTMGYYLSMAKFCQDNKCRKYYRKSLTVPVLFHGIFDFLLMSSLSYGFILFIPFVIYLWIVSLKKLNIYYKESKFNNS